MSSEWEMAGDPDEVHALLIASDAHQAAATGTPIPRRSRTTTARYVAEARTHLLRVDGIAAGTFTFVAASAEAMRIGRLAVLPALLARGAPVGLRCVRRALDLAAAAGAKQLRSEANPDIVGTFVLLRMLGFRPCGPIGTSNSGARTVELAAVLAQPPGDGTRLAS